eukprot:TRINITY_DN1299_c0_g1_i1.p1 TRINITY_DN1299_c0_g1~~TRINITY_DN1299_c0_g1_i1.p1  ORF type:complete len:334 (-),score=44.68 TRINITY_DN1299_c0_g1_i1:20-1000(-)
MGTSSSSQVIRQHRMRQEQREAEGQNETDAEGATLPAMAALLAHNPPNHELAPPIHVPMPQRVPNGLLPLPPPAEMIETTVVPNAVNLRKASLALVPAAGSSSTTGSNLRFQIQFVVDAELPFLVEVYLACICVPSGGGYQFLPQTPALPVCAIPTTSVAPQLGYQHVTPASHCIDLGLYASHLSYNNSVSSLIPVAICLSYDVLGEKGSKKQVQYTFCEVSLQPTSPTSAGEKPRLSVVKQCLLANGTLFELREIFGTSDPTGTGEGEDHLCVVCISSERDTTLMPCAHMCLCAECADQLRRQTNRCPICRTNVTNLIQVKCATE